MRFVATVFLLLLTFSENHPSSAGPDQVTGGAGWVGAGLLGSVLAWLLFVHLPAKDKQLKELLEGKDKQIEAILTRKWTMIQELTKDYKDDLKGVNEHWQTQNGLLIEAIQDLSTKIDTLFRPNNNK